jgi:hypothetical protein
MNAPPGSRHLHDERAVPRRDAGIDCSLRPEATSRCSFSATSADSFGEAYNYGVRDAFHNAFESVVVCNDDIVFTPTTWETLLTDVGNLRANIENLGWVATRSDYARGAQNIRIGRGGMNFLRFESEQHILRTDIIAPICAWIHRDAWIDFPPINWFSDDVQCLEMKRQHFISRAYVHHVGSQTCGMDVKKCMDDAEPWLRANRPELHARWYLTNRG